MVGMKFKELSVWLKVLGLVLGIGVELGKLYVLL